MGLSRSISGSAEFSRHARSTLDALSHRGCHRRTVAVESRGSGSRAADVSAASVRIRTRAVCRRRPHSCERTARREAGRTPPAGGGRGDTALEAEQARLCGRLCSARIGCMYDVCSFARAIGCPTLWSDLLDAQRATTSPTQSPCDARARAQDAHRSRKDRPLQVYLATHTVHVRTGGDGGGAARPISAVGPPILHGHPNCSRSRPGIAVSTWHSKTCSARCVYGHV
jgi:hypothetical protein